MTKSGVITLRAASALGVLAEAMWAPQAVSTVEELTGPCGSVIVFLLQHSKPFESAGPILHIRKSFVSTYICTSALLPSARHWRAVFLAVSCFRLLGSAWQAFWLQWAGGTSWPRSFLVPVTCCACVGHLQA